MKVHSIGQVKLTHRMTPAQRGERFAALGPIAARHGQFPKGTVLPETLGPAIDQDGKRICPRVRMADLPEGHVPPKYYERNLVQNQLIASCCRHPENHEIEALKSHPEEPAPDIYIFHCTCGRMHRRMLCGSSDDVPRPLWKADAA